MFQLRKSSWAAWTVVVCLLGLVAAASAQFETRGSYPVGSPSPRSVTVGDFNRDGNLDIAVGGTRLSVLMGNGDGTFQKPVQYAVGVNPESVATADLNGDGNLDLVAANFDGPSVSILLGNGDGTFQPAQDFGLGLQPTYVGVGDFNGDHKLDLVFFDDNSKQIQVLLGNGDGSFQEPPIETDWPYSPQALAIGDFDGDGKLDLAVVANSSGASDHVEILLGNGDGRFRQGAEYILGATLECVAVADFRGNGKLDLAIGTFFGGLEVLLGNGDGTFANAVNYFASISLWVTTADFNGDGKLDIAVAEFSQPTGARVFLGNGDGSFQAGVYYPAGSGNRFIAAADFNNDHQPDLVITDDYDAVVVLLNTGVVTFAPTAPLTFLPQLIGTASAPLTLSLTNSGKGTLTISSIAAHGQFHQTTTCKRSVPAGASCAINITFQPQSEGFKTGLISISDSASSKPQVIEVNGYGTVVSFSPSQLSFPPQKLNTKSAPMLVKMTNEGSSVLNITSISIGGNERRDFSETNNCRLHLASGASCKISVTFDPTKVGSRSATLFANDDGGGGSQPVPLTGTGTQ